MLIFPLLATNIRGHLQRPPGPPRASQSGAINGCARQCHGHAARRGCAVTHHGQWHSQGLREQCLCLGYGQGL